MNRDAVLIKAMTDVMKERASRGKMQVQLPLTADLTIPPVDMTAVAEAINAQKLDMTPFIEANDRLMYSLQDLLKRPPQVTVTVPESPAPQVTVTVPQSPSVPPAQITVNVDLAPLADAIQKQTEALESVVGRMLLCLEKGLDRGKEIEIIKDSAGRITGARRK